MIKLILRPIHKCSSSGIIYEWNNGKWFGAIAPLSDQTHCRDCGETLPDPTKLNKIETEKELNEYGIPNKVIYGIRKERKKRISKKDR